MINSQVLTRQWRGPAPGFGRSQTLLGEDSAAGDGKFQNLSKSCLVRVLKPEPYRHPSVQGPWKPGSGSVLWAPLQGQDEARPPGLRGSSWPKYATAINTALLRELLGAHVPRPSLHLSPFKACPARGLFPDSNLSSPPRHRMPGKLISKGKSEEQRGSSICLGPTICFF